MKPTRFELAVLTVAAAIIVYQNFIPPLIGLADSGDFERLFPQTGLAHKATEYRDKYFRHFNSKYAVRPRVSTPEGYASSTSVVIRAARWISIRAGQDEVFDIRVLAAVYLVIMLLGIWLILLASRALDPILRLVLAGLLVLIFTDVGYIAYFNSYYSEPTALSFLAVGVGSALLLADGRSTSRGVLILYFLAVIVLVTSKPMYTPLAPMMALLGVVFVSRRPLDRVILVGTLAVATCGFAFAYYHQTPELLRKQSAYIGIFMDLLPNSSTPREDLVALGLNPDYDAFSGTTPYQRDSPMNDPEFREHFFAAVDSGSLAWFYITRPNRLYALIDRCMKHAFSTRVRRLGYYEESSGRPARAHPFGPWSAVRERVFPRSTLFLGLFFATGIIAAGLLIRATSRISRFLYLLYLLFIFIAGTQFLIAILAGGGEPDLEKHLFMFNTAFDGCLILAAVGTVHLFQSLKPTLRVLKREKQGDRSDEATARDKAEELPVTVDSTVRNDAI